MFEIAIIIVVMLVAFALIISALESKKSEFRTIGIIAGIALLFICLGATAKYIADRDSRIEELDRQLYNKNKYIEQLLLLKDKPKESGIIFDWTTEDTIVIRGTR